MAAATSAVVVTASGVSSFISHLATAAQPQWGVWIATMIAVLLGSQLGSRLMAGRMKSRAVKLVFGWVLLGYLALLAAWLARRLLPRLGKIAALAFWGMAVFAVVFSIYLTYLEPFVIKAVCAWCLASAVIVTLLLLLGTSPVVHQFTTSSEGE